jgi:hypothetical protein
MSAAGSVAFVRVLLATNLKATLALRGAFVVQAVFMALNNLAFFVFWWVLMGHVFLDPRLAPRRHCSANWHRCSGVRAGDVARRRGPPSWPVDRGRRPGHTANAAEVRARLRGGHAVAAFRLWRRALFTVLPAGLVGDIPARMVQAPSLSDVVLLAGGAIAYTGLAMMVFEYGLRRYASASRFTTFG